MKIRLRSLAGLLLVPVLLAGSGMLSGCKQNGNGSETGAHATDTAGVTGTMAEVTETIAETEITPVTEPETSVSVHPEIPVETLALPASSGTFSKTLALQLLKLCSGYSESGTDALFAEAGFEVLLRKNYDKELSDPAHTCAYTIGKKQISFDGAERTAVLVAVRGTSGGEWYSNFDFAPSHSNDTVYAENFLFAAQDVYLSLAPVLTSVEDPLIIVSGHSRGAACANLLGTLLDAAVDASGVYVYTYATPTTVRGAAAEKTYDNIFNIINPCDVVPMVPLSAWGYRRAGTDLMLANDEKAADELKTSVAQLVQLAPDIESYYNTRHSLTQAGESEDGLSVFAVCTLFCQSLVMQTAANAGGDGTGSLTGMISEDSDFYPLIQVVSQLGGAMTQHMPDIYAALIAAMPEV